MVLSARQNEIVTAVLGLIAAGGIQNLTMKKIAARLGVSEPALYRHFSGKSEIVKELIRGFDEGIPDRSGESVGFESVKTFVRDRLRQASENPPLARVMFSEELFMDDPEFSGLCMEMRHRHRVRMCRDFAAAAAAGEIRNDIAPEMLFALVFGPVRMLVKQWGMSGGAFELMNKGEELLDALTKMLARAERSAK